LALAMTFAIVVEQTATGVSLLKALAAYPPSATPKRTNKPTASRTVIKVSFFCTATPRLKKLIISALPKRELRSVFATF
jgi:hypothetical protein